jgi:HAD superfamily hydrolase (TIGR01509 family)
MLNQTPDRWINQPLMPLKQRDCWIFDMDGTLTLSIHDFERIKRDLGLPPGQPILEELAKLPPEVADPLYQQLEALELAIAHQSIAQDGAYELLSELRSRDYQIGILTRNSKNNADATLAACGLADFFDPEHILSRDCCAPKPSPAGILSLLKAWDAAPERSVMVGDYAFDLEAGRRAGSRTVYIDPTGKFVWQAQADVAITSLTEIAAML